MEQTWVNGWERMWVTGRVHSYSSESGMDMRNLPKNIFLEIAFTSYRNIL